MMCLHLQRRSFSYLLTSLHCAWSHLYLINAQLFALTIKIIFVLEIMSGRMLVRVELLMFSVGKWTAWAAPTQNVAGHTGIDGGTRRDSQFSQSISFPFNQFLTEVPYFITHLLSYQSSNPSCHSLHQVVRDWKAWILKQRRRTKLTGRSGDLDCISSTNVTVLHIIFFGRDVFKKGPDHLVDVSELSPIIRINQSLESFCLGIHYFELCIKIFLNTTNMLRRVLTGIVHLSSLCASHIRGTLHKHL